MYCGSENWDAANSNYNSVIKPVLDHLEQAQIRRILVAHQEEHADLPGSHGFSEFVRYVYDNERLPRHEVITTLKDRGLPRHAAELEQQPTDEEGAGEMPIPF